MNQPVERPEKIQIYRVSKRWKLFLWVFTPPLIILFGGSMIWFLTRLDHLEPRSLGMYLLFFCFQILLAGMSGYFIYGLVSLQKYRLEIHDDQIRDIGVFRTTQLNIADIKGFKILPFQYHKKLFVIPVNSDLKTLKIDLALERQAELLNWLEEHLVDLIKVETEKEMDEIRSNAEVGSSVEDRLKCFRQAKAMAWILNGLGVIVTGWGFIYPRPYQLAIWALILTPVVTLVLSSFYRNLIKVDNPITSAYPSIGIALFMPSFVLAIRVMKDYSILSWTHFWVPFTFVSLAWIGVLFLRDPVNLNAKVMFISRILLCCVYGFGAVISMNGLLDDAVATKYVTRIVDKKIKGDDSSRFCLILEPVTGINLPKETEVQRWIYAKYETGDIVSVIVRPGKFRIPWFYVR